MGTSELAAFGLFCVSIIGYMAITALVGAITAHDDMENFGIVAWLAGALMFGLAMIVLYGK